MKEADYPHLKNAPIVEALLDIRVQLPSDRDIGKVYSIFDIVKKEFPIQQKLFKFQGSIAIKGDTPVMEHTADSHLDGFFFFTEDKTRAIQVRHDGFTFHMQKPYTNWENFKSEAQYYWNIYKETVSPVFISRTELKYINKIEVPTMFEPSDYFNTIPILGGRIAQYAVTTLFAQISIFNPKINSNANITEGIESIDKDRSNFIFDIDVFSNDNFDDKNIWEKFDELHSFKNEIFFDSITPKTEKLLR